MPNPRQIQARNYTAAREILVRAGSDSARASHIPHGGGRGSVPCDWGTSLLAEARDEFRGGAHGGDLHAGMSQDQYTAIHAAADTMGIEIW